MDLRAIETYLHEHIPLSRALGVRVAALDDGGARLEAPLEPNLNHRGTGFGGSLSALGVLAGWTLLHAGLRREGIDARLVIRRHHVDFTAPAEGTLVATAAAPDREAWAAFLRAYRRRGRAPIDVAGTMLGGGVEVGAFGGRYAALRSVREG